MSAELEPRPTRLSPVAKAWRFTRLLLRPKLTRNLGTLVTDGYLAETGWVRSVLEGKIVDMHEGPQPWATLPYIEFVRPRLRAQWSVFEYGSGASTLFFARRVRCVGAVEHDSSFAAALQRHLPSNVRLTIAPAGSADYAAAILNCDIAPEVVSVDGVDRVACIQTAIDHMAPAGVIVLDDAERSEYAEARTALTDAGFRAIEFWGLAPGWVRRKCTTVYYRARNVLGI